jgi:hypothetical protein
VEEIEEPAAPEPPAAAEPAPAPPAEEPEPPLSFEFIESVVDSSRGDEHMDPDSENLPARASSEHPMAALFEKIWDESEREAVVELRLTTGEMITPVHYSHDYSRGQHGIFGSLDREGRHVLEVIPWDNIARVTVRGLSELPATLFDVPGG